MCFIKVILFSHPLSLTCQETLLFGSSFSSVWCFLQFPRRKDEHFNKNSRSGYFFFNKFGWVLDTLLSLFNIFITYFSLKLYPTPLSNPSATSGPWPSFFCWGPCWTHKKHLGSFRYWLRTSVNEDMRGFPQCPAIWGSHNTCCDMLGISHKNQK